MFSVSEAEWRSCLVVFGLLVIFAMFGVYQAVQAVVYVWQHVHWQ